MSQLPNPYQAYVQPLDYAQAEERSAVFAFFNQVYAWMATGLALTGGVAYYVSTQPQIYQKLSPGILLVLFLVTIGLVATISAAVEKLNATVATVLFLLYAGIMGLFLSAVFLVYTQSSITSTFLVTAGTFGAMSVYGMVTKTDLTSIGSFLIMALFGLIIASVVNIFWANSTLYWIITYAGVLIFVGLTAYDTQRLKHVALATANDAKRASRYAINGALTLYLDFINLFLLLLRILGDRR